MSRGKLTEAQVAVLRRMAGGDEAWTVTGRHPRAFWHSDLTDKSPRFDTLHALQRAGLIESYEPPPRAGNKYRITEAGRSYLSSLKDTTDGR